MQLSTSYDFYDDLINLIIYSFFAELVVLQRKINTLLIQDIQNNTNNKQLKIRYILFIEKTNISISNTLLKTQSEGKYNLNDLYRDVIL